MVSVWYWPKYAVPEATLHCNLYVVAEVVLGLSKKLKVCGLAVLPSEFEVMLASCLLLLAVIPAPITVLSLLNLITPWFVQDKTKVKKTKTLFDDDEGVISKVTPDIAPKLPLVVDLKGKVLFLLSF